MKLADLAEGLREALGIVQKRDIQLVSRQLREARGPAFEHAHSRSEIRSGSLSPISKTWRLTARHTVPASSIPADTGG